MRLVAVLAVLLLAPSSSAQGFGSNDLQPYERVSANGRHRVSVAPSQRDGSGPAEYTANRDGTVVWSGTKPWTFWDSLVTDDGFVAGYSYSEDGIRDLADGDFHAVILAPDGSVKLDEKHPRTGSNFPHVASNPLANGVFEIPGSQRVVFRIADPDVNRQHEEWWCFQLPDAREVFRKRPADVVKDVGDAIVDATGIPGTPLVAVQWRTFDWPRIDFGCVVHDADLRVVWKSGPLDEFGRGNRDESRKEDQTLFAIYREGAVSAGTAVGRFDYRLARTKETVRYVAERTGEAWAVRELGRENSASTASVVLAAKFADLPFTPLVSRGEFALATSAVPDSPVRDVVAFAPGADGKLRFVRKEGADGVSLLRVDETARVLLERKGEIGDRLPQVPLRWWPLDEKHWLATQSPLGEDAKSRAWRVDDETGVATRLDEFACPAVESVGGLGDGRFVVLATWNGEYTSHDVLAAFDATGRTLWRIEGDSEPEDPAGLFGAKAMCVTSDGVVVVIDVIRHTLQFFDAQGKFQRAIELDDAFGRKANYPSGVTADRDGGVLVEDFHGEPPLYRMKKDGSVTAKFAPRFPDGRTTDGLNREARVAPDGRVWTHDGDRLLRLDEKGVVDLVVGPRADPDVLAKPSATAIDVFGRALVQDAATGAVHVFDGKGKRRFVCRPDPTDFQDPNSIGHLAATRDRGVVAEIDGSTFVGFGPDGRRTATIQIPNRGRSLVYSPVRDCAYAGRFQKGFFRLDAKLEPDVAFDRGPDGAWIVGGDEPAIAPDGALAVVSGPASPSGSPAIVLFETAEPGASRSIPLPAGTPTHCLNVGAKWIAVAGFGDVALLVERAGDRRLRVRAPSTEPGTRFLRFGFDPETGDLLALDASGGRLSRFALP